jgi:retinol dehydrogenase 14
VTGRICLVTGATSGIGRATALGLARLGATVCLVARDRARGEAAVADIRAASDAPVELLLSDLSLQASVRELAGEALDRFERLHVLVNNAGVSLRRRLLTTDGLETTFAVNHLAPFLLTNLLLERLEESTPARIVNVTSTAFRHGRIRFDDLQGERRWSGIRAYNQSKLATVFFTLELARRLEGTGVTANCVHPGVVPMKLGLESRLFRILSVFTNPFLLSPEEGAATSLYVASAPELEGASGKFFAKSGEAPLTERARDQALARRLWEVSAELTGLSR